MKKSLLKVTAIAVCFAFLLLAFPGVIEAKPRSSKYYYQNFFRKPLALFAQFMSFLPFYDMPSLDEPQMYETKTVTKKLSKKMKITGGLSSHRPSKED